MSAFWRTVEDVISTEWYCDHEGCMSSEFGCDNPREAALKHTQETGHLTRAFRTHRQVFDGVATIEEQNQ